jgi:hypothetical protein
MSNPNFNLNPFEAPRSTEDQALTPAQALAQGQALLRNPEHRSSVHLGLAILRDLAHQKHGAAAETLANFFWYHPEYVLHGAYERQAYAWMAEAAGLWQDRHFENFSPMEWPELQKTIELLQGPIPEDADDEGDDIEFEDDVD